MQARRASGCQHVVMTDSTRIAPMRIWPFLVFIGLVNLGIGIALVVWPSATLAVVAILVGLQLLVAGILQLFMGVVGPDDDGRWMVIFVGLLGVVAGLVVMREPLRVIELVVVVVGVFWVVSGIVRLAVAAAGSLPSRSRTALDGLVSVAAGALVLAWPDPTLRVVVLLVGILAIVRGLVTLALAMEARKAETA